MTTIAEIKARARIEQVFVALGGGPLRGTRARAFWRDGGSFCVSLDVERGLWHDFVTNSGGDAVSLVQTVLRCDFRAAAEWLSGHTGVPLSARTAGTQTTPDTDWAADLQRATWWSMTARILGEHALEDLPHCHPDRHGLTVLLQTIRSGDAAVVAEYRQWRRIRPRFTDGMIHVGKLHDARIQRRLAHWLVGDCGTTPAK